MPKYSIVVPFHNEEENVTKLYDRVKDVMEHVDEMCIRDSLGRVDLAGEAGFSAHGGCPTAELGGREHVAGLVDQCAREVLAFADDDSLAEAALHLGFGLLVGFGMHYGDGVQACLLYTSRCV